MKRKLLALLLSGVLLVGSAGAAFTPAKTYTPGQFTDVAANVWYAASVQKVYELNLMNGSSATTFNPSGMFTVAEALTVAGRMHSLSHGGSGSLPAAAGAWYQGAVDYCLQNKLITSGQFDSYTRAATRAEMAGVIRAALPDDQWKAINSVSALPDVNMGNEYAQAIFDLYNAGVFTGSDDYGMFQPYAYITRAEVAAIVARCADPSQRKTLSLKPLSQREAPELIGGYQSRKMSNGRLAYQDPTTQKWGYLDGSGAAVIPAQYDAAENFVAGYAWVKVGENWGMIDTSGRVSLPLLYSKWIDDFSEVNGYWDLDVEKFVVGAYVVRGPNGYGLVYNGKLVSADNYESILPCQGPSKDTRVQRALVCMNDKYGVIDLTGKEIVPCLYSWYSQRLHNFGSHQDTCRTADNSDGYVIAFHRGEVVPKDGYNLYNCTATLYNSQGKIVAEKSDIAGQSRKRTEELYNGNKTWWQYDRPGIKNAPIFSNGNPLFASCEGEKWAVGDSNGLFTDALYDRVTLPENSDFAIVHYGNLKGLVGRAGEIFTPGTYDDFEAKGEYVIVKKGGKTVGVANVTGMLPGSEEDYLPKEDKVYAEPNPYQIRSNDIGKPCVYYGNDKTGWTPVIEYYKNNMYYDEIRELGEGYYACRFNTTWYLLHA